MRPQIVPDDAYPADLGPEPDGWYDDAQGDIEGWAAMYVDGQEDDGSAD